jgi:preprotein translocase subunit SecA
VVEETARGGDRRRVHRPQDARPALVGRPAPGGRDQGGLPPRQENQTLATITYQNYFRLFKKLAGMTGTALTEASEFYKIYRLRRDPDPDQPARRAPTTTTSSTAPSRRSGRRSSRRSTAGARARPAALIGTTSVEKSREPRASCSRSTAFPHEVLNAKNHEREANIVAHAGARGAVTVATNMAGRGTDIKLGGNFEWRLRRALEEAGCARAIWSTWPRSTRSRKRVRAECDRDQAEVLSLGGLYVLGTERHEARRIDNQLRGRSGRQGDAGTSRFFLSLEDDLMRRFYRDWVKNAMESWA